MPMTDILNLTATELAAQIQRREVSPVEVIRAVHQRLDATEAALNCFISRRDDEAMDEARAAEAEIGAGRYRGPLHGLPLAVKDNIAVAGTVTTAGAKFLADNVTHEDAESVRRLRAAGAIVVGKTNLHELAAGSTTINIHYGTTPNPWALDRVAGGSSGGSAAALAARQLPLAIGTDHAGSIRMPGSLCGVVGLKPTHGRVSVRGLVGARNITADHIGPMTRTVADAALMLEAMAGHDALDPASIDRPVPSYRETLDAGVSGLRLGVPTSYFFDLLDPAVEQGTRAAILLLEQLGARLVEVELPDLEAMMAARIAMAAEGLAALDPDLRAHPEQFGEELRHQLYALYLIPARDLARSNRVRRLVQDLFRQVFEQVDLLATPTTVVPAFPIAAAAVTLRDSRSGQDVTVPSSSILSRTTSPLNLTGLPAVSVPAGFTATGLPFGLQLVGPAFEEASVLRAAHAYEQATRWHERVPDLSEAVT
ncbi:MAG: amidase [Chloroflexi bacterium]|nr:amidase [Chloroflexota bacterium]